MNAFEAAGFDKAESKVLQDVCDFHGIEPTSMIAMIRGTEGPNIGALEELGIRLKPKSILRRNIERTKIWKIMRRLYYNLLERTLWKWNLPSKEDIRKAVQGTLLFGGVLTGFTFSIVLILTRIGLTESHPELSFAITVIGGASATWGLIHWIARS